MNFTEIPVLNLTEIQTDYINANSYNYTDWELINTYCTNLNNHLINIMILFFMFFIIVEINLYLKNKGKKNWYEKLRSEYLNTQYFLYLYFVYVWFAQLDILKHIFKYRYWFICLLVMLGGWKLVNWLRNENRKV